MADSTIQDIITHAVNNEADQVKVSVYDILQAKVADYLDDRTKFVGKTMFKKPQEAEVIAAAPKVVSTEAKVA